MQFQDITYDIDQAIATIAFNRPDAMNAARHETVAELIEALDLADKDDTVKCVIVTGKGRAFCAGTDISNGFTLPTGGNPETGEAIPRDLGGVVVLRVFEMSKPVIGAINGAAAGFGATFTLAFDMRLASDNAKFAFPFTRRGICVESCSSWYLPRLVGMQTAMDWMLTGRTFGVAEAERRGLVHEVCAPQDLMTRARQIATDIAENCSPASVAINRRMLLAMMSAGHPEIAHELESRAVSACMSGPDIKEGAASFLEKRKPNFSSTVADADFMKKW